MNYKTLFEQAYEHLIDHWGDRPDVRILNRFYHEKMYLQESDYMRMLALVASVRARAREMGEHIAVRGTVQASLMAYLLGATDINPLPTHQYCPECKKTTFTENGSPYDRRFQTCSCGAMSYTDGYDLPFETNLREVLLERIQIGVSPSFFEAAKNIIREEMWDHALITLGGEQPTAPTWICFADREVNDDAEYRLKEDAPLFERLPRITLVPMKMLDRYRRLESETGVNMEDVGREGNDKVRAVLLGGDFENIPNVDSSLMRELAEKTNPSNYEELLKLIGFVHGTRGWVGNAEWLYDKHRVTLDDIPAFREDVFDIVRKKLWEKGCYENGLAYEVAEKTRTGYYSRHGMDQETMRGLLSLGVDMDFIFMIERIEYMFPKAHAVSYMKDAVILTWYKLHYPQEFSRVFLGA